MSMIPYTIQGPARQCCMTGKELKPGESFYSALIEKGGQLVRMDYSEDAWTGAPTAALAFWKGRIPTSSKPVRPTFNDDVLVDCFEHLGTSTESPKQHLRYVVALLLMRRKRFKFEDVRKHDGKEWLSLKDVRKGIRHEVLDPRLTDDEMARVQEEIFQALGWDA